ncbi:MAG TPA: hypothetical protein OIL97_06775 [Oscillospiraceae bacterium]|jgi:hypothetical protein|nr:hypothetical protein [Ruminococcus sp. 1001270H_150608_F2]HJI49215.1 hypothetical protein [Oscillospiraceae bacterium]
MAEVDLTKKKQREIKKEIKRLEEVYKDIDVKRKDLLPGLIENAAFTRITLKYLAEDLKENGTTEMFSQSENQTPYSRRRPEADLYNTMTGNYLKFIKQLDDMLPKAVEKPTEKIDFLDNFVNSRDEI